MVDSQETVTLSWENINVHVNPKSRACCRGPDPSAVPKHVLRNGKLHVSRVLCFKIGQLWYFVFFSNNES